jgi:hypothetical protein
MSDVYFRLQDDIHKLCRGEDADGLPELRERLASKAFQRYDESGRNTPRFLEMLDQHETRLKKGQSYDKWRARKLRGTRVFLGHREVKLHKDDHGFLKEIAEHNELTVQELVDRYFDNEYQHYVDDEGHFAQMWTNGSKARLPEAVFTRHALVGLRYLCVSQARGKVLDLRGLEEQTFDKLIVQSSKSVRELYLSGAPEVLEVHFLDKIERLDIQSLDVSQLLSASVRWCKKGLEIHCLKSQHKEHAAELRLIRGGKKIKH